jgi:predicted lipid-binding transport protein (Tim44 family)
MDSSPLLRISALIALLGFAAFSAPSQQAPASTGDPVADAARKARTEQKTAPKPKKVFTNDDIPSAKPASAPATDAAKTDGKPEADGKPQAGDQSGKKELDPEDDPKQAAYWQKRSRTLRNKLSTAEQELDVLQRELSKDELQYYPDPQKALMQQYNRSDINEKRAKVDAKKGEVDSLKQQVADLEDSVRKAGGDPGWVR